MSAISADFEHFIQGHRGDDGEFVYMDQLNNMMASGKPTLHVNIEHLPLILCKYVIDNPEKAIQDIREAALRTLEYIHNDYWQEVKDEFRIALDGVPLTAMKSLLGSTVCKLVSFEGKAVAMTDTEPVCIEMTCQCSNCGSRTISTTGENPRKCSACGETVFEIVDQKFADQRAIKIQEIVNNERPTSIACMLTNSKDFWAVQLGKRYIVTGVMKVLSWKDSKTKELHWLKRVYVTNIKQSEKSDIVLSQSDIAFIKNLPDTPQIYEKLRESIAPFLYGLEELKEAGMLALASQGTERPLNLMFIGDPQTGKTDVMEYCVMLSHNGHETDMANSTKVGLTVESKFDEDLQMRIASPGILSFADGGLVGIDEFSSIDKTDAEKLNKVLDSKIIISDKAGVHEEFPARCTVILTANSYFGKWNSGTSIFENMKFLPEKTIAALLTRFDLIYITLDRQNVDVDERKADAVLRSRAKAEKPTDNYLLDTSEVFGIQTLRKYFYYISKLPLPIIDLKDIEAFKGKYLAARAKDNNDIIGLRYLETIIRLAKVIARILQRDIVMLEDLERAMQLLNKSLDTSAFDPRTQKIDPNLMNGREPQSVINKRISKENEFWTGFEHAIVTKDGKEYATRESIIEALTTFPNNWKREDVEKYIDRFANGSNPKLYEPYGRGMYKRL